MSIDPVKYITTVEELMNHLDIKITMERFELIIL